MLGVQNQFPSKAGKTLAAQAAGQHHLLHLLFEHWNSHNREWLSSHQSHAGLGWNYLAVST
jgi:hypothetical protein